MVAGSQGPSPSSTERFDYIMLALKCLADLGKNHEKIAENELERWTPPLAGWRKVTSEDLRLLNENPSAVGRLPFYEPLSREDPVVPTIFIDHLPQLLATCQSWMGSSFWYLGVAVPTGVMQAVGGELPPKSWSVT